MPGNEHCRTFPPVSCRHKWRWVLERLTRPKVDAQSSEVGGAGLLRGAIEDFGLPSYLEAHKAGSFDKRLKLCFQQSAGDSTSPKLNFLLRLLWHRRLHQDVANLKPSSRLQCLVHSGQGGFFVWNQVEDTVGNEHISPTIGHG